MSNFEPKPFRSIRFAQILGSAFTGDVAAAIAGVAIPLLIVQTLQGSDGLVGIAVAADDVGWLIAGPVAGVLIDRYGFKRLLLGSEFLRFAAFGTLTILVMSSALDPIVMIALLIVKSLASVFFLIGSPNLLARGVIHEDLVKANSALTFSQSFSLILGPPLAGAIAALASPKLAFAITSIAYLVSFLLLSIVLRGRRWETPQTTTGRRSFWSQFVDGWRYLRGRSDVVRMVCAGAQFNFALSMQQAVIVIYLLSLAGFTPAGVGLALGAAGLGGVVAAMFADKISQRWGDARAVFWLVLAGTVVGLLIPLTHSVATTPFLACGYFGLTVATVVFSAITGSYRQRTIPADLLGRVTASSRFISWGIAPFGALAGGGIATILSPWWGLAAAAVLFVGTPFWLLGIRWISLHEDPGAPSDKVSERA